VLGVPDHVRNKRREPVVRLVQTVSVNAQQKWLQNERRLKEIEKNHNEPDPNETETSARILLFIIIDRKRFGFLYTSSG
jgi:hypothetical protein